MKVAKFFALLFAIVGIVLMLGTTFLAFGSMDRPVRVLENPDNALSCSEQLQRNLNDGDLAAAAALMHGQPSFGAESAPQDGYTALLWEAFCDSLSFTYTSNLYLLDAELTRDGVVTVMDVTAVMDTVQAKAKEILAQKSPEEVYNEDGTLREEAAEQILEEALRTVLTGDLPCISQNVIIRVIRRDDQWWILPDQAFLDTITGFSS